MQNKIERGIDVCMYTLEETHNLFSEDRLTREQLVAPKWQISPKA